MYVNRILSLAFASFLVSNATAQERCPLIGTLETNAYRIVVLCANNEALYDVESLSSNKKRFGLTATELENEFPQLGELIRSGVAKDAGLDAKYQPSKSAELR